MEAYIHCSSSCTLHTLSDPVTNFCHTFSCSGNMNSKVGHSLYFHILLVCSRFLYIENKEFSANGHLLKKLTLTNSTQKVLIYIFNLWVNQSWNVETFFQLWLTKQVLRDILTVGYNLPCSLLNKVRIESSLLKLIVLLLYVGRLFVIAFLNRHGWVIVNPGSIDVTTVYRIGSR